jgi:hypothetical protein
MPVKGIYKKNLPDMQKFMLSEQARRPCVEVAKAIVAELAVTVTRSKSTKGVHLADDYHVNEHPEPVVLGGAPRVGAEVYSSNPAAAPEEFGGKGGARNKPRRWLGKAGAKYHVPMGGKA